MSLRVALTTYSTKPRGGVIHTLELAESLVELGVDTTVIAMGDPAEGFFRPVKVPVEIIPAPQWRDTLEERVFAWIEAMSRGLSRLAPTFDVVHSHLHVHALVFGRLAGSAAAGKRSSWCVRSTTSTTSPPEP